VGQNRPGKGGSNDQKMVVHHVAWALGNDLYEVNTKQKKKGQGHKATNTQLMHSVTIGKKKNSSAERRIRGENKITMIVYGTGRTPSGMGEKGISGSE